MILKYFSDNPCPRSIYTYTYSPPIEMQGAYHLINSGLHRMKRKLIGNFFRVVWNTWHICLFVRLKKVPSFLCLSSSSNNPTCFAKKKPFAFLSSPACILQVCSIQILKKVSYDCYSCLADYDDLKKNPNASNDRSHKSRIYLLLWVILALAFKISFFFNSRKQRSPQCPIFFFVGIRISKSLYVLVQDKQKQIHCFIPF